MLYLIEYKWKILLIFSGVLAVFGTLASDLLLLFLSFCILIIKPLFILSYKLDSLDAKKYLFYCFVTFVIAGIVYITEIHDNVASSKVSDNISGNIKYDEKKPHQCPIDKDSCRICGKRSELYGYSKPVEKEVILFPEEGQVLTENQVSIKTPEGKEEFRKQMGWLRDICDEYALKEYQKKHGINVGENNQINKKTPENKERDEYIKIMNEIEAVTAAKGKYPKSTFTGEAKTKNAPEEKSKITPSSFKEIK